MTRYHIYPSLRSDGVLDDTTKVRVLVAGGLCVYTSQSALTQGLNTTDIGSSLSTRTITHSDKVGPSNIVYKCCSHKPTLDNPSTTA